MPGMNGAVAEIIIPNKELNNFNIREKQNNSVENERIYANNNKNHKTDNKRDRFEKSSGDNISPEEEAYRNIGKSKILNRLKESETNQDNNNKDTQNSEQSGTSSLETIKRPNELTPNQEKAVRELEKIDRDVRNHEAAHRSAGGGLVKGNTSYTYSAGPDGKQYAVGGEVKIDMSYNLENPEETIRKMQQVKRAALAPADPSGQDRSVAMKANAIESEANAELQKKRSAKSKN